MKSNLPDRLLQLVVLLIYVLPWYITIHTGNIKKAYYYKCLLFYSSCVLKICYVFDTWKVYCILYENWFEERLFSFIFALLMVLLFLFSPCFSKSNINPFVPNVPFLHPLKTWCFQWVKKGCIGNKRVNSDETL